MLLSWIGFCPWCFFVLHVTYSCIARFFPSFLCLKVSFVTMFLSFLSLSLSLSFSLLVMAPKKFVPSENPICRGFSSSSFPPDSIKFRDEKARNDFFENFSDRAIHSKHQVILFDFPNTPLPNSISSQGWDSLCEEPSRCLDVFIQEFYSKMHTIDTSVPRFTTLFHGTRIIVTLDFIFEVLHNPRVDCPNYPSHPRLWEGYVVGRYP